MKTFQISKYNPVKRNSKGFYPIDEWTAISDIGKIYNGFCFTEEEYMKTEGRYINILRNIAISANFETFLIKDLQKLSLSERKYQNIYSKEDLSVYSKLNAEEEFDISTMLIVSRLMLREDFHGTIEEIDSKLIIEFGYDYYMYITIDEKLFATLEEECVKQDLFIE